VRDVCSPGVYSAHRVNLQLLWYDVVSGQAGAWAAPLRWILSGAEAGYRIGLDRRNRRLEDPLSRVRLDVPVISVGNITTGGTGKTPFVIHLAQRLVQLGRRPGVVSRGYKAPADQPNEEQLLIEKSCPEAICIAEADRVTGARAASDRGANVILLDDGFQHRRLERDVDIVLIDATCPFGFERLLPRGLLREPISALGRAALIVITRVDQILAPELTRIERRIADAAPQAAVVRSSHRVTRVRTLNGRDCNEPLSGRRAYLTAALGNPRSFLTTTKSLGIEVTGWKWWPDHHRYRASEVRSLLRQALQGPQDVLVTTAKDAVKLERLDGLPRDRIWVIEVAIDLPASAATMLDQTLRKGAGLACDS